MLWKLIKINNAAINNHQLASNASGKPSFFLTQQGKLLINLVSYFILFGASAFFGYFLAPDMASQGLTSLYFSVFVGEACLFSLMGSVYALYVMLYKSADNSILLPLPLKSQTILLARLSSAYLTSFEINNIIVLGGTVAYFCFVSFDVTILAMMLAAFVLLPFFSLSLGMALTWIYALILRISPLSQKATQTLLYFLGLGLYLGFIAMGATAENIEVLGFMHRYFPVFTIAGEFLTGSLVALLKFAAITLLPFTALSWLMSRNILSYTISKEERHKKQAYQVQERKARGIVVLLLAKDFKQLGSDPALLMNYMGSIPIIVVLVLINLFVIGKEVDLSLLSYDPIVMYFTGFGVAFISLFMSGTSALVALEGTRLAYVKTMPIPAMSYVYSKILLGAGSLMAMDLILLAAISMVIRPDVPAFVLCLVFALSFAFCMQVLAVLISMMRVRIQGLNAVQTLKRSANNLIYSIVCVLLLAPPALLYVVPNILDWWPLALEPLPVFTMASLCYVLMAVGALVFLRRNAQRFLDCIEL